VWRWLRRSVAGAALVAGVAPAAAFERVDGPLESAPLAPSFDSYREFGSRDGLRQSSAYALVQDRDGYIWAGSEDGVARYDGRRWRAIDLPGARPAPPFVQALAAVADGAVWIGTDERGLIRWAGDRALAFDASRGLDEHNVQALAPAGADAVWVGTPSGVARCDPNRCRRLAATAALDVAALLPGLDAGGREVLWLGTRSHGVRRLDDPHAAAALAAWKVDAADGLPSSMVRALAQWGGPAGRDLWIGSAFGFARVAGERLLVYGERHGVTSSAVSAMLPSVADDGTPVLLISVQRGGLIEVRDDGRWSRTTVRQGLPDENLYSLLLTDRDRPVPRLWIGTQSSGVIRRDAQRWHTIDMRQGLPHRAIRGLGVARFPDGVERRWIGTVGGSMRLEGASWVPFGPPPLARAIVNAAENGPDGSLWLATDLGLVRWRGDAIEIYDHHRTRMPFNTIIALRGRHDARGRYELWLGTRHGLSRVVDGEVELPGAWPQNLGPTVRSFAETTAADGTRTLWAAGEGGIEGYDGARWRREHDACLPHLEVMDLRVTGTPGAQVLWVATRGGIARIPVVAPQQCQRLVPPVLPSATVYQLQFDAAGRLYLFGYDGAYRLIPARDAPEQLARMTLQRFDESDGLPALEFNRASYVDADGRIWAGTIAGVAVFEPTREAPPQGAKPLLLERAVVSASGRALQPGSVLRPTASSVRFEYALMSYEREHLTRYRTELLGLGEPPSAWSAEGHTSYERLPPGAYTFRVWGRDALGTVSGPREFGFRVAKPLWQRPWALAGFAAVLLLAGAGVGRLRERALAARATELAREVDERTRELHEANRQLERASLTDPLTGLPNRRWFGARLAGELERVVAAAGERAPHEPRLLCLLDLDYFKTVNDRYGHAAGDAVLVEVGACLRELAGEHGAALRWGGEEFLVVLPLAAGADPLQRAQQLVDRVRNGRHVVAGRELSITGSVGWAVWPWNATHPRQVGLDQLLTLADLALYRAKETGRNRAVGALCDEHAAPLAEHPELRVRWRAVE
jgi:diguanylate cyclase (GGDEF)-like protein